MVTAHQVTIVILAEWNVCCYSLSFSHSWELAWIRRKNPRSLSILFAHKFLAAATLVSSEQRMYFSVPCFSALYNVVLVTGNVLHLFSILHLMKTSIVYIKVIPIQLPESHSNITSQETFPKTPESARAFHNLISSTLNFLGEFISKLLGTVSSI